MESQAENNESDHLTETGAETEEKIALEDEPQNDEVARHVAEKENAIRQACDLRDYDALISYATSEGGFLNDDVRRLAWPILLQCDRRGQDLDFTGWDELPPHVDEEQVQLDVNRSFVYYPECSDEELSTKKGELSKLIKQVLRCFPMLCYFQGYHDIVQVLLLVLGGQDAAAAVAQISLLRIRDYMLPSLSPALKHLQLIPAIIEKADPALRRHLAEIKPFFALAATLTLYSHDIQEYSDIARLFDFLLAQEPVVSIYLFAAIILSRKKELLEISVDEPEMLHFTLSKLPNPLDLDGLISRSMQLFDDYPPESLAFGAWKQIPDCSVLKSSRDLVKIQTTKDTVGLFEKQVRQLRYEERKEKTIAFLWSHRRAIGSVAVTILVGAMSVWIKKKGFDNTIWSYVSKFHGALQARGYL
ncbi:TBC domain-containing protein [Aspergillus ibericus CBS 121593]|uniref:TBC domain protein n=1 Tax=Aspergillus ibericus CBS 121593 TaxID=1448316 RepID=A0A395GUK5_9EURO|nr:TBC domain protein [Aspergillus ibericus CBS 121593]RAK99109.1 TBC domain protein [Aspergillus ibericus CBS 121593]